MRIAAVGALVCGLAAPMFAETTSDHNLQAEVAALRAEVAQLRQAQGDNWLNERRAEEVRGLIREVLADAETRQSLLQDGMVAGHDGEKFFLASPDGGFLMVVGGQIQFRWIGKSQERVTDEEDSGFQVRRTKLKFGGHIGDPRIGYDLVLATERDTGDVFVEDVAVSYDLTDNVEIKAGKFKLPFLREELTISSRQLAVERSSVNEYFTGNRAEQIQLTYSQENWRVIGSFSDGFGSEFSEFDQDTVEYAFTARGDVKLAGEWGQAKDFTAWSGEDLGAFVGAAVHYEAGDGNNGGTSNYFTWTIDGSVETNGVGVYGAFIGGHIDPDAAAADDRDMYGFVVQGSYNINDKLEPFIRWEWLDDDDASDDELQIATVGANYYLNGHDAKFTVDLLWAYEGAVVSNPFGANALSDGLGFADDTASIDEEDYLALRAQFQLLF